MFHTIKSQDNFQNIYKTGKKIYGTYSLLFYKENQMNHNQYGFVASKKIGNAVCRNRIKRLFREFIKQNEILLPKSTTFILVAKKKSGEEIKTIKYEQIEKDLYKIFKIKK
ncbi:MULTISPECIES: ribonuclease P protein component [Fusobacterium]|uniref:Ribonuclease P protein component n=1 Tax=Fusobacterium equinum TaxID=134605 RepID=A0A133NLL4_9FUSO|nr:MULTISPECIES: ribonuclease P protein component [Fusobacterium]AVQ16287.1 ribonuclease P protein component [Fusobacterium gonidiaformans ATCC 25563]EFS28492.2 ribonuclease P protein component [Fusobacterium gonidiaformans ATCC 25563]KXA17180.1 ribonuclease P protein component [Fusobacterium equinum]